MKRHAEKVLLAFPFDLRRDEAYLLLRRWRRITDFGDQISSRSFCNTVYKNANVRDLDTKEEREAEAKEYTFAIEEPRPALFF